MTQAVASELSGQDIKPTIAAIVGPKGLIE